MLLAGGADGGLFIVIGRKLAKQTLRASAQAV